MLNIYNYFKTAPSFTVWNSHPSQKSQILITAGVDGDEYVGIEAAKKIITNYKGSIPITVIPLVNVAGNQAKMSMNPLDGRFPKHIFPGSIFGSSSSQLMYQIGKLLKNNSLWIDLHGGASNEHLNPFVWAGRSNNASVDNKIVSLLSHIKGTVVYEQNTTLVPTRYLAQKGIGYILLESGELGIIQKDSVDNLLSWVKGILDSLGKSSLPNWKPTYNKVIYEKYVNQDLRAKNVLWYSSSLYVSGKIT